MLMGVDRRMFLGGVMASRLAGTGAAQPEPMNAPPARELSIGVQPGVPNIIRARVVIVSGASGGVFLYSPGAPGVGNLVASMTEATNDPFGNPTLPGVVSYGAFSEIAQLVAGVLRLGATTDPTLGQIDATGGAMHFNSGT